MLGKWKYNILTSHFVNLKIKFPTFHPILNRKIILCTMKKWSRNILSNKAQIITFPQRPDSLSYQYLPGFNLCGGKGHLSNSAISSGFKGNPLTISCSGRSWLAQHYFSAFIICLTSRGLNVGSSGLGIIKKGGGVELIINEPLLIKIYPS